LTTVLAVEPASDRIFVGERGGKIFALPADRDAAEADLFLDTGALAKRLNGPGKPEIVFDSLYGMEFDPKFSENRFVYVCYVVKPADRKAPQLPDGTRVSRFRVSDTDPPRADPESEELIISWLHGGHNGGCIKFGPDGNLYVSTGDGGVAFPPDGLNSGQDMTTLLAKVLRIDVRKPDGAKPYSIPSDNPFVSLAGARGETWAYGLRNPWKMSFDRATGDLWVGDVGWELWELVYRVNKGDNFGWSIVEGSQPVHTERKLGPTPIVRPTMEIPHTEGASITGGFVYRGKRLPELVGTYIFGDWETRRMWGAKVEGTKLGERYEIIDPVVRIVDFAESRDGELYLLDHDDGSIYTLAPNTASGEENRFPRKLSETGLFESVERHAPAPGVLPFSINVEQWSDHATAERWVGVPGSGSIQIRPKPKLVPGSQFSRAVEHPKDTVLLKTLSLEMVAGDPSTSRRIETQALHYDGREWQGYTYEWNESQTDASLVERTGKDKVFQIVDRAAPGGKRTQTWRFSSRNECLRCHNPWSEYALAFSLPQLNREHDFGGVRDNQIRTLRHVGILADLIDPPDPYDPYAKPEPRREPEELPKLSPPFDESIDVSLRARSYLHVNCGHCHRFNGGGSSYIYLQHDIPLADVKAVGVRPTQGTFGIHDAQLLAPGDPYRSVLYFRLAKTGPGHMPHLGAKIVDERALELVHDWIRKLPVRLEDTAKVDRLIALDEPAVLAREREEGPAAAWQIAKRMATAQKRDRPSDADLAKGKRQWEEQAAAGVGQRAAERKQLVEELLSSPTKALLVAEAEREGRLPATIRAQVMEAALLATTDPAVRDLFEAFVPEERRTKRLGDTIDPAAILKLAGDLENGRKLFHESTVVQCRSCHRIGGKGTEIGPDLDAIGKKYERPKLLESILQPSLAIDPKYTMWLVETSEGKVHSGLLVSRDAAAVVLKDAKNVQQRIAAGDVEGIFPQTKSLMPDMLLRDFTAQQVADLLEYLASLKAGP
jgi:putative heme-binding domain-containing protein